MNLIIGLRYVATLLSDTYCPNSFVDIFASCVQMFYGSPLKQNKSLTVTQLKCHHKNTTLNVQIQMNHLFNTQIKTNISVLVSTLIS